MDVSVAIIGSGPAGLTAAIYSGRAMLKTVVIAGLEYGGQLMTTSEVENFPGFPDGVQGPDLMAKMRRQAERYGAVIMEQNAQKLDISRRPFRIMTAVTGVSAQVVILAMGATPRELGLPSERRLRGHGVSTCATCDGFFFRGKTVVVVGGGDSAMEEAEFLTRFATKVYVIHRREELRASKIMQKKAQDNPKIEFILNAQVTEILGDAKVTGVRLDGGHGSDITELSTDGVFVAIGHEPNSAFLKGQIDLDARGYVMAQNSVTSVPGVFVAGDLHDHKYRQAVTAAGMGCIAALEAERYLTYTHSG